MAEAELQLPAPGIPTGPLAGSLLRDAEIARALGAVRAHLGADVAFVARYVEGGEREITHVHADGSAPYFVGQREAVEQSYCWHILESRLPELIRDAADQPFARSLASTHAFPVGAHVGVPLRLSDGSVWGSFGAFSHRSDPTLSHRDLATLRAFAGLTAQRIEQAIEDETCRAAAHARVTEMLDGHAITIFHQPIHALADDAPVGVECLARFPNTKKRGTHTWFEDAEKVGLGSELEMAAVRCALETLGHLPPGKFASVNISPAAIEIGALESALDGCDTSRLVIEVTQPDKSADFERLVHRLAQLRGRVRLAIDDVGTSYAGLRHIVDLKPDMLKMDMALTRDIHRDPARRALTGALVQLAREIGCQLVAEGIESVEERDAMAALGVQLGQGYFYARPLPVVAAQRHLLGSGPVDEADLGERPDVDPAHIAAYDQAVDVAFAELRQAAQG